MSKQWGHGFYSGARSEEINTALKQSDYQHAELAWVACSLCQEIDRVIGEEWQDWSEDFQNLRFKIIALEKVYLSLSESIQGKINRKTSTEPAAAN